MKVELCYEVMVDSVTHSICVGNMGLDQAWKSIKAICEANTIPVPTEEDYKAGRLTKTIIQE